jgi:hypothetical protein
MLTEKLLIGYLKQDKESGQEIRKCRVSYKGNVKWIYGELFFNVLAFIAPANIRGNKAKPTTATPEPKKKINLTPSFPLS